ncbi:MAG TPA: Fic family protein [Candidatus Nitrosotalea sp.]|nr:Fic family protein [Candidatus Nitrosotalea sp.]
MTSNDKILMNLDNQYLIDVNEKILKRYEKIKKVKVYIETTKNIDRVIPTVNSVGNSGNREKDLIEKAACIMAVIPWTQAFFDGNRRTGIIAASKFLYDNGYELDIDPGSENLELRHMLSEIKKQTQTLNQDIMKQLSFYVSRRIKKL